MIGAGYGDISAERAYIRTENLSCVRHDGRTLEVKIHGSIFGEDGKVGVRGRLVSKQGRDPRNALIAGVRIQASVRPFRPRRPPPPSHRWARSAPLPTARNWRPA